LIFSSEKNNAEKSALIKRVVISVTTDLSSDQRVQKVCKSLHENGFEVYLIGRFLPDSIPLDFPFKYHRFRLLFNKGFLFYANFNIRLFFKLCWFKKNILLSNDLDTLLPNYLIGKIFKKKVVYDSHELFLELPELINRPLVKNCWRLIEKNIIPKLTHCYTVCDAISKHYRNLYGTEFGVIKNLPNKRETQNGVCEKSELKKTGNYLILYQGSLNIYRGLELMIEAMQFLDNAIFQIVGSGIMRNQLFQKMQKLNLHDKIKFIPRVPPNELQKLTVQADLGVSVEEDKGLNYRYALPNKLFDYLQAGIPILVSNLPEMRKIVDQYKVGEVIIERNPKKLAAQIAQLLEKKDSYKEAIKKAKNELVWENQEEKLLAFFR
jgi:glycosyltransferase involved in cell wall biosynthesis